MKQSFEALVSSHTSTIFMPKFTNEYNFMVHLYADRRFPILRQDIQRWFRRLKLNGQNEEGFPYELVNEPRTQDDEYPDPFAVCRPLKLPSHITDRINGTSTHKEHSQRAEALRLAGYYEAAFEDWECARAAGLPKSDLDGLLMDQAMCAYELGQTARLRRVLGELSEKFKRQPENQEKLTKYEAMLQEEATTSGIDDSRAKGDIGEGFAIMQTKTAVETSNRKKCRLVCTQDIAADELLFTDEAVAVAPAQCHHPVAICGNCARLVLTPFPCADCSGETQYCCLRCRTQHHALHQYECQAVAKGLHRLMGPLFHLALRVIIAELPDLVAMLSGKTTNLEFWREISGHGSIITPDMLLSQSLLAPTNLRESPREAIMSHALAAQLMLHYLKSLVAMHQAFAVSKLTIGQLEIAIAALCMRRLAQMSYHAHPLQSLQFATPPSPDAMHSQLLADQVWQRPDHLSKGNCHLMALTVSHAIAFVPYLSHCRRSCRFNSFLYQSDGLEGRAVALQPLKKGDQVLRGHGALPCATVDCVNQNDAALVRRMQETRSQRCEFSRCGFVFVAPRFVNIGPEESANQTPLTFEQEIIMCPQCKLLQPHLLLKSLQQKLRTDSPLQYEERQEIYSLYGDLGQLYLGAHEVKTQMAQCIVHYCLEIERVGGGLQAGEFAQILPLVLHNLEWHASYDPPMCLEYTAAAMPLLDLIALGHYRPPWQQLQQLYERCLMTAIGEFKKFITNYYNDYIKDLYLDQLSRKIYDLI